ncbi:hypothetical protein B0H67DRAFT_41116 [Lasiosphaeris hirsuta]|uniref:Uncharacterized protein n=1 Tax=Lasiosphaeris hirsuta TaxID=260670 RepID=A0AA40BAE6_9PEZI|nr:hypothetical protein B0H67DRAFT_41116 [Lasiosphaeris hirsuta]
MGCLLLFGLPCGSSAGVQNRDRGQWLPSLSTLLFLLGLLATISHLVTRSAQEERGVTQETMLAELVQGLSNSYV